MVAIIARRCVVVWMAGLCSITIREGRRASLRMAGLLHCQSVDGPTLKLKSGGGDPRANGFLVLLSIPCSRPLLWDQPRFGSGRTDIRVEWSN